MVTAEDDLRIQSESKRWHCRAVEVLARPVWGPVRVVGHDKGRSIEHAPEPAARVVIQPVVVDDGVALGNVVTQELVVHVRIEAGPAAPRAGLADVNAVMSIASSLPPG